MTKRELSVKEILGNDEEGNRRLLREFAAAGDNWLTQEEICKRLLGRQLTAAEQNLVALADEACDHEDNQVNVAFIDLVSKGAFIDSGDRSDDGRILWVAIQ